MFDVGNSCRSFSAPVNGIKWPRGGELCDSWLAVIKRGGCSLCAVGQMSPHLLGRRSEMSSVSHRASGNTGSGAARSL